MQKYIFPTAQKKFFYGLGLSLLFAFLDFDFLSLAAFVYSIVVLFVYRVKQVHNVAHNPEEVSLNVSGKVVAIKPSDKEHYEKMVVIESGFLDNGSLIVPMNSEIKNVSFKRGTRLDKKDFLFTKLNEMLTLTLEKEEKKLAIVHILKKSPFGLEFFAKEKQKLQVGEIYGYGCCMVTTIYLPEGFSLAIQLDQKVNAYETLLGYFPKEN
ncbi:MAG: hypothetical protein GXO11_08220 [Epsilonproteobacteria bacterium]|nr:hypothetical protein [Campylobacterota bacterium]